MSRPDRKYIETFRKIRIQQRVSDRGESQYRVLHDGKWMGSRDNTFKEALKYAAELDALFNAEWSDWEDTDGVEAE